MLDKDVANELKILGLEAILNAGSGHSGSVMSVVDILYTLYTRHMVASANKSNSVLRDRFVLSNGHASGGLYPLLAGLGYFNIDELKKFRSYGGMLTGHPEIGIPGIDASTGPLGQGVANAVGMAIAETILNAKFKLEHYTYCMAGDGCLQEGVALEALSIAGLYKLNKFILLYDKNDVTLDGSLKNSSCDDISQKFLSMGFYVQECKGNDISAIDKAISNAKKCKDKPSVIIFHTIIGQYSSLEGSHLSHGKVFEKQEIDAIRKKLGVNSPNLCLSEQSFDILKDYSAKAEQKLLKREEKFYAYLKQNKLTSLFNNYLKNNFKYNLKTNFKDISTREANGKLLTQFALKMQNVVALSADLFSSTKAKIDGGGEYSASNRLGRNIAMGIREHAMGGIANGIALHGGLLVVCSTFLSFSNYMLPAVRMSAFMRLKVMYVYTHSSIYDTTDGGTHLPVEQLDQLRLIPNTIVCRPKDANECADCYKFWLDANGPIVLSLSRGELPQFAKNELSIKGAYKMYTGGGIYIWASGSEVSIANEVREILKDKIDANIISVNSLEILEKQSKNYINSLLNRPIFVIESGTCVKYLQYTKRENIFNVTLFGKSGDSNNLKKEYGYVAKDIANKILKILKIK